ncbi:hypothetical protein PB1_16099 [Bacillus methanolicus PB1]|uniref:Uncharacterized protein n=1 Tax=Bacillus methanolicus PB1 TaxID=997296 RepID=I3DXX4_BACMT|nr:hypothetical protein [Bacillus methanolicus]EIJ79095.1 hypothetical protein PB1_16099 [Bacillus methanolicus PB1]
MDVLFDIFKNRPGKSVSSLIVAIVSFVTLIMFQELKVETLSEFVNYISNNKDSKALLLTWGFNLFTFGFLILMGILWIKDIVRDNYLDISPEIGRIVSFIIGILHFAYSVLFLQYIFSKLLGIVIAVVIVLVIINGDSSRRR